MSHEVLLVYTHKSHQDVLEQALTLQQQVKKRKTLDGVQDLPRACDRSPKLLLKGVAAYPCAFILVFTASEYSMPLSKEHLSMNKAILSPCIEHQSYVVPHIHFNWLISLCDCGSWPSTLMQLMNLYYHLYNNLFVSQTNNCVGSCAKFSLLLQSQGS